MQQQIITIIINSDIDPATLLDIITDQIGPQIVNEIETYGEEATFLEEEVSVENGDEVYGGE